jgi:hypothetical protein
MLALQLDLAADVSITRINAMRTRVKAFQPLMGERAGRRIDQSIANRPLTINRYIGPHRYWQERAWLSYRGSIPWGNH